MALDGEKYSHSSAWLSIRREFICESSLSLIVAAIRLSSGIEPSRSTNNPVKPRAQLLILEYGTRLFRSFSLGCFGDSSSAFYLLVQHKDRYSQDKGHPGNPRGITHVSLTWNSTD